jgi:hypothetical protein
MTLSPDLLALGFLVVPALIGGAIALVQSKYLDERELPQRQEPTFSLTQSTSTFSSDRKEPTFDQV